MSDYGPPIVGGVVGAFVGALALVGAQYYFDIVTSIETAERIASLSADVAQYRTKYEAEESAQMAAKIRISALETEISQIPPELKAAKSDIERLETQLNDTNVELNATISEVDSLKKQQQEAVTARRALEVNYAALESAFGELANFAIYAEAVEVLGEDKVRAILTNAQKSLRNFGNSQRIFGDEIAPVFNGKFTKLAEQEGLEPSTLFTEIFAIMGQKESRLENIDAASSRLISQEQ